MYEGSFSPTFLPTFVVGGDLNDSYSNRREVESWCSFSMLFRVHIWVSDLYSHEIFKVFKWPLCEVLGHLKVFSHISSIMYVLCFHSDYYHYLQFLCLQILLLLLSFTVLLHSHFPIILLKCTSSLKVLQYLLPVRSL
jgi:hypothetical protein